jgi:hypothetical protein
LSKLIPNWFLPTVSTLVLVEVVEISISTQCQWRRLALLYFAPRAATVKALQESVAPWLEKQTQNTSMFPTSCHTEHLVSPGNLLVFWVWDVCYLAVCELDVCCLFRGLGHW